MSKVNKAWLKKDDEELQRYLQFRTRGGKVPSKKGKGSFNRAKAKQNFRKES